MGARDVTGLGAEGLDTETAGFGADAFADGLEVGIVDFDAVTG